MRVTCRNNNCGKKTADETWFWKKSVSVQKAALAPSGPSLRIIHRVIKLRFLSACVGYSFGEKNLA